MLLKVVLVVPGSLPKWARSDYLGHNDSGSQARCVDVGDGVESGASLFFAGIKTGGMDASAFPFALSVQRGRIVDLEEELKENSVRNRITFVNDLHRLGVIAMFLIGGIRGVPAGPSDSGRDDPGLTTHEFLSTPITATRQDRRLLFHKILPQ